MRCMHTFIVSQTPVYCLVYQIYSFCYLSTPSFVVLYLLTQIFIAAINASIFRSSGASHFIYLGYYPQIQFIILVLFITPLSCVADKEKQAEGEGNHGKQDSGGNCKDRAEKQNTLKGKGSRKTSKSNMKNTSSTFVKPSFPTKKRVQVPQCPFSETPTRLAILEGELSEIAREEPKRSSTILKDKPVLNDKGEPVLSPFFWLRDEEDVEKSSQHTDEDQFLDMTPLNAPAFSDIKDSDDEYPSSSTPTVSA